MVQATISLEQLYEEDSRKSISCQATQTKG